MANFNALGFSRGLGIFAKPLHDHICGYSKKTDWSIVVEAKSKGVRSMRLRGEEGSGYKSAETICQPLPFCSGQY